MFRNFLFRILITLYCIIGAPIWFATVCFYWAFGISMFVVLSPLAWLFFGSVGFEMVCKLIDLDTYRKMIGLPKESDAHITPLWFFTIFEKLRDNYDSNSCKRFR